jgi:hypothetical protein
MVHEVLRSPGQPLDTATRAAMEPHFGHDFSHVKVHNDSKAAESAQSVNALAYTVGPHLVLGAQHYAPHSEAGQKLLAHELTHIVQLGNTPSSSPAHLTVGPTNTEAEKEAEIMAGNITSGHGAVSLSVSSAPELLHRQAAQPDAAVEDKPKREKKAITQPAQQKIPASKVKETEKEKKGAEAAASVSVETETKKEDEKTTTEKAGKFKIEATIPLTDTLHLGRHLFFVNELGGSMGGKLNFSELEWEETLKLISLDFEKVKVPLGLLDIGFGGSAIYSGEADLRENKYTTKFGFGVGGETKFRRTEQSPVFIKIEVGLEKTYDQEGNATFKWSPLIFKTSFSVGINF